MNALREIIESGSEIEKKILMIDSLAKRPGFTQVVEALLRFQEHPGTLASWWFCKQIHDKFIGVGKILAMNLYLAGFYTPEKIRMASDQDLLKVKGLAKGTLNKIRTTGPDFSKRQAYLDSFDEQRDNYRAMLGNMEVEMISAHGGEIHSDEKRGRRAEAETVRV